MFTEGVRQRCRPGALEDVGNRRPCPWVTGGCECERERSGAGGQHGCGRGGCDRTPVLLSSGRPGMQRKGSWGCGQLCLVWWCKVQKETP